MTTGEARLRSPRAFGWEATALRWLEWVATPALAGAAFCLLSLGVITWLPALAAVAQVLYRWRTDGDGRAFLGVFATFGHYWHRLWRHALLSTAAVAVLLANLLFLFGRTSGAGFALFAVQVGIGAALVPYHVGLAAYAGRAPDASATAWRRLAIVLAFGGWRGPVLLVAVATVIVITLPTGVGPLLFGPTLPLLLALTLTERLDRSENV